MSLWKWCYRKQGEVLPDNELPKFTAKDARALINERYSVVAVTKYWEKEILPKVIEYSKGGFGRLVVDCDLELGSKLANHAKDLGFVVDRRGREVILTW